MSVALCRLSRCVPGLIDEVMCLHGTVVMQSQLGKGQADPPGCKLRADEGLDSISELAPGYFVPKATTVYSSLIQHLADEFGYDVCDTFTATVGVCLCASVMTADMFCLVILAGWQLDRGAVRLATQPKQVGGEGPFIYNVEAEAGSGTEAAQTTGNRGRAQYGQSDIFVLHRVAEANGPPVESLVGQAHLELCGVCGSFARSSSNPPWRLIRGTDGRADLRLAV